MRTPKKWSDNLKRGIITDEMLESALFSVNKRAKNYRDKKREYSHYRYARHDYSGEAEAKMNEMYEKKDRLLSLIPPVCIHLEYQQNRQGDRVEIGDSVDQYLKYIYTGEITHFGSYVRRNRSRYDDWYDEEYVYFFDHTKEPFQKAYYLFRVLGSHSFHTPITVSDLRSYPNLPVIAIDGLITQGEDVLELCSMQFVDKVIALIDSGTYTYEHTDHADQDYIRSAESADASALVEEARRENTNEAVEYFSEMIAYDMEAYASQHMQNQGRRDQPNMQEKKAWNKRAENEYRKNIRAIRKYLAKPAKGGKHRTFKALDNLDRADIHVSINTKVTAYRDKGRLMHFVYSTADMYYGRSDVTVKELVEALPPDTSPDAVLKDPEKTAQNYIRHRYREIIDSHREEIEDLRQKLNGK